jgi:type I restriction enzyme S subunit
MGKMKKYDSYKDSGIEWIGEIPSHWIIHRIDWISNIVRGNTPFKKDELLDVGEYVALQYGKTYKVDVVDDSFNFFVNNEFFNESQIVSSGDTILISTSETIEDLGHTCFYSNKNIGLIGGEQILLKPNLDFVYEKYLYHYSRQFGSELKKYAKGLKVFRFSTSDLKRLFIALPTIEEQTAIANYLDQKTAQIDELIAKKERLIQLLEEERTALINQAVTKGLDPTVPMKDSGIDWLGEIPAHWEEARIKNVVNIIGRIGFRGYTTQDLVQKGEGAISLSPSNIKNHILNLDDCTFLSWEKYHESPEIKIFENDIILVKTGSTIGKTAIIPNRTPEMTLNPQLVVFKDIKLNPVFLYYIMISNYFQGYFSIYTAGGSTPAISQEKINNFKITFPRELEQLEISNFISQKESEIKRIISKTQQEIELLKEYKTALISEVVSGKVDVRYEKLS